MNSGNATGVAASAVIMTIPTANGTSAFFDYYVNNSSTGAYRAGTVMCVWSSSAVAYTDTSTPDLVASTAGIEFTVDISASNVRLNAVITAGTWKVKVGTRVI
jgi:hypothetical protein